MKQETRACAGILGLLVIGLTVLGMMVLGGPVHANEAADGKYLDMGQAVVQLPSTDCAIRNLAVSYQLEYRDTSKAAYLTANKPKVQSVVFGALSDYFATHKTYTFETVRLLLDAELQEAFGKDTVAAVIITQVVEFGQ
jgi:hypothetical protein